MTAFALMTVAEALPTTIGARNPIECVPNTWRDVLVFFLVNYVTHAITVKTLPGETAIASAFYQIVAFFLPFSGVLRGIQSIRTAAVFADDKLQIAARAGALCIVARSGDWRPEGQDINGCTVQGDILEGQEKQKVKLLVQECQDSPMIPINTMAFRLHGQCVLPQGYHLVRLPESVTISLDHDAPCEFACSQTKVKVILSIIQLSYACVRVGRYVMRHGT